MSDEQDTRPEGQQTGNAPDMSWDKDRFPTSVAPIVRSALLLILAIVVICFAVYSQSEEKIDRNAPDNNLIGVDDEDSDIGF